jgi:hypothetical protein
MDSGHCRIRYSSSQYRGDQYPRQLTPGDSCRNHAENKKLAGDRIIAGCRHMYFTQLHGPWTHTLKKLCPSLRRKRWKTGNYISEEQKNSSTIWAKEVPLS